MNLRVIQQHTLLCADPAYQSGMFAALDDGESSRELTAIYRSRAEYRTGRLSGTGCEPIQADGGFYAILRCEERNAAHGFASSKELARDIIESGPCRGGAGDGLRRPAGPVSGLLRRPLQRGHRPASPVLHRLSHGRLGR